MTTAIKWRPKRDADGNIIPGCWETSAGYTVAEFRTPEVTYGITRPGEKAPSFYTPERKGAPEVANAHLSKIRGMLGGRRG